MYLKLFWAFFQIGLFSIGGGYAALPLIQDKIVEVNGWLTMSEFADLIALSQMSPGPIGTSSAIFAGIKVQGILGGIAAMLGSIVPSFIIVLVLAFLYYKYRNLRVLQGALKSIRPAVAALITSAGITILTLALFGEEKVSLPNLDYQALIIFIIAFFAVRVNKGRINIVWIMLGSGVLGLLEYFLLHRI